MVSIHGPLGYGPSTLPLRHSADTHYQLILSIYLVFKGCHCVRNYFPLYSNHFCFICNQNIATVRDPKYIDVIYINERCTQLNKILLNMFSILPPIISPDHFVCTMGGVVFFVTILKWHPAASKWTARWWETQLCHILLIGYIYLKRWTIV